MDEKGYYELKTDIANLKKLHEQLESLHRQQTEKISQTKSNESLTKAEGPGKIHECTSLYAQGIRNLREEFPKRAQSIKDKIAVYFDAAYFKELEIDQKIIALESKASPYTLIDQTVAVLGLVREAQKYSLLSEITEGDYADLLNLYRIALRKNNRTTLAFIEGRLEKLTRKPGNNREDEAAKKALLGLVERSVAKRLEPKVYELKDLFDAVVMEHDCLIKDMDKDIKKPEAPQEQTGLEIINRVDETEPFDEKREDRDDSEKLYIESTGGKRGGPGEIEMVEQPESLKQLTETPMEPPETPQGTPFETSEGQQSPPLELLEQQPGSPPELSDEQQAPPLESPEEHADLPLEPLEQPSGLVMETPVETLLPTAETMKDREDATESLTEPPDEKMEDPEDLLLQAWVETLDKRTGPTVEGPEQQADPPLEERGVHSGLLLEPREQQQGPHPEPHQEEQQTPPLEQAGEHAGPPLKQAGQQEGPPLEEPLEEHTDLPLEPLEQPSGLVMETPVEALQPIAETREDRKDTTESLTEPPDEKIEDLGDILLQAWTEALDKRPGPPAEGPEQQADPSLEDILAHSGPSLEQAGQQEGSPLEHAEEHAGPPLEYAEQQEGSPLENAEEHAGPPLEYAEQQEGSPLVSLEQQTDLLLEYLEEQPEIVMEPPVEAMQTSAEAQKGQKDAPESLKESPDEKMEDPGKMLIRAWRETLGQHPDAPLENPEEQPVPPLESESLMEETDLPLEYLEEQPEIVMELPAEALQSTEEKGEDQEDASETLVESPDENIEDLGKILVQEWMKTLEHKTETSSETPEEQTEITMKAPEETPESPEETAEAREDATESPMEHSEERIEDLGKILVHEWMKILEQKPSTPWTLPEEQAEQPPGIPGDELSPQEEKREGTEYTTETLLEKPLETMDVSKALERIRSIERTKPLKKTKPMDLTDALERINTLEKLWSLGKIHALPAKTKTPKKTAQKKRKKTQTKKGKRKKAKK